MENAALLSAASAENCRLKLIHCPWAESNSRCAEVMVAPCGITTFVKRKPVKLVVVDPPLPIQNVLVDDSSAPPTSFTSLVAALICRVIV